MFSIVIPNYNHSEFLPRCLDSIFTQDYADIEVLVCDDGSTDSSLEVLTSYQARYPELKILQNPGNMGVMATLIKLYHSARGEYFLSLGADDMVAAGYLAQIKSVIQQYHPPMIFSDVHVELVDHQIDLNHTFGQFSEFWDPQKFMARYQQLPYFVGGSTVHKADLLLQELATAQQLGPLFDFWINHAIAFLRGAYYVHGEYCHFTAYTSSYGARNRNYKLYHKLLTCLAQPQYRLLRERYRQATGLRTHGPNALLAILCSPKNYDLLTPYLCFNSLKVWLLNPLRQRFPKLYGKIFKTVKKITALVSKA